MQKWLEDGAIKQIKNRINTDIRKIIESGEDYYKQQEKTLSGATIMSNIKEMLIRIKLYQSKSWWN